MKNNSDSFLTERIKSIQHALDGISEMFNSQPNARIHFTATILVISVALFFNVTSTEWCLLILVITSILVSEALNTACEYLCDVVSPGFHPLIKKSKDVAAGAVLISSFGAIVIGIIIFYPYLKIVL